MPDEPTDVVGCLGCDLTAGRRDLPGGRIASTEHWVVEPCVGPLSVGSLIVKPRRHCTRLCDLTAEEAGELGPLLRRAVRLVQALCAPDQTYVCLWSHAGWQPGHIHFVVQPVWNAMRAEHPLQGPFLQAAMFEANVAPARAEVEAFVDRARAWLQAQDEA